jgi:N-acetylmuramoyl-L-alanine amidase
VPPTAARGGALVVIDPGHNGGNGRHVGDISRRVDAGGFRKACNTVGTSTDAGYPESRFTWELSLALRAELRRRGVRVLLTRGSNDGWGPCVDHRSDVANRQRADLLVSLHADGAASSGHGFHVIVPGLVPGYTDDIRSVSSRLGVAIRDALVRRGLTPSTYVGRRGLDTRTDLGTLNHSDVPAAMVECGNMRNAGDAAVLTSGRGQRRVALALADGVTGFLRDRG